MFVIAEILLGYPDSNQKKQDQNLLCCQLHHTPNLGYNLLFLDYGCKNTGFF